MEGRFHITCKSQLQQIIDHGKIFSESLEEVLPKQCGKVPEDPAFPCASSTRREGVGKHFVYDLFWKQLTCFL